MCQSDPVNQKHDQGAKVYDFNLQDNDEEADPKLKMVGWTGRGVMKVDDDQDNDDYPKVMTFQRRAAKDNDD